MSLIALIVLLAVIGGILYFINVKIPMPGWLKTTINVVVAIAVLVLLLQVFGIWNEVRGVQVPKL